MKKSFKQWTRQELKKVFNLTQTDTLKPLQDWTDTTSIVLSESEQEFLAHLLKKSLRYVDSWNETELREKFIIKILELVDFEFEEQECHSFAERYLSVTTQNVTLYGFADWFVATGTQFPEKPFFFIHEYKPEGAKELDGRGQLLATMLATKTINDDNLPIYGTFVQGRLWFFLVYDGVQFAETPAFDILKINDLLEVFKILKQQKMMIIQRLNIKV